MLPFEIMCDASDYAIGAIFGQTKDKKHHAIACASKTLTGYQLNDATTKKELLAVVFAIDKFRSYLVGAKIVVYTDHAVDTHYRPFPSVNLIRKSLEFAFLTRIFIQISP
jgi:hypothetical protein